MNPLSRAWLLRRQRFVRDRNSNEGLCLDVGSGLHPICSSCVKVDVDKYADIQADAQHLPFKEASFNTIFALEVIEHLNKPEQFLEEANRVLTEKGKLILTTPKNGFLWKLIWYGWIHTVSKRKGCMLHTNKFTLSQLAKHFKINQVCQVNFFLQYIEALKNG